jgi:hypothetical protein
MSTSFVPSSQHPISSPLMPQPPQTLVPEPELGAPTEQGPGTQQTNICSIQPPHSHVLNIRYRLQSLSCKYRPNPAGRIQLF